MSELTMAVLVCNRDGRVLLYNARASALLGEEGPLGLGRPLGALIDADALDHAWGQVLRLHAQGAPHAVAHFVTALRGGGAAAGTLLRVQMVPTEDEAGAPGGYVLLVDDITRAAGAHQRREARLRQLTLGLRSGLANLRAAAQALARYPAMDAGRRAGLGAVVHDEAERLARQPRPGTARAPRARRARRGRRGRQSLWRRLCARRGAGRRPGAGAATHPRRRAAAAGLRIRRCRGGAPVAPRQPRRRAGAGGARPPRARGGGADDLALAVAGPPHAPRLELSWRGTPLAPGTLEAWEGEEALAGTGSAAGSLRQLLDRHGAELWSSAEADGQRHRVCLQLARAADLPDPTAPAAAPPRAASRAVPHRPVAYDFDLFHQAGQNARLDEQPLATLACTVFDTETTGLKPSEGDEVIALGAVRIVNARLLEHECFERRVRPSRSVRASAEAVHGISTASLAGEPPLQAVLPAFARFCGDTVLVAHNAAFDLRFLELARARTGVAFEQPVLDTMLLSAAALPGLGADEHHLEQIAARLGVPAAGRHQALGDALITARVFLKLLPLLAARGIVTLGQAREASRAVAGAHETF
ncbi:MAG: exonuclease domain-containing protein [Rubrivivax sp.]